MSSIDHNARATTGGFRIRSDEVVLWADSPSRRGVATASSIFPLLSAFIVAGWLWVILPLSGLSLPPTTLTAICAVAAILVFVGQLHSLAKFRANTLFVVTNERVAVHIAGDHPACHLLSRSVELDDVDVPSLEQRRRGDDVIWLLANQQPARFWFSVLGFPGWSGRPYQMAFFLVRQDSERVFQVLVNALAERSAAN